MGTKTLLLTLCLLVLPGAVAAEDAIENEPAPQEQCEPLRVYVSPPDVHVEPECAPKWHAEESK